MAEHNDKAVTMLAALTLMKDIRAQRDELLGVLREARACMSIDGTYGKMRPQQKLVVLNRINKAIARAEGK